MNNSMFRLFDGMIISSFSGSAVPGKVWPPLTSVDITARTTHGGVISLADSATAVLPRVRGGTRLPCAPDSRRSSLLD